MVLHTNKNNDNKKGYN